jgi:hypothetical protein
MQLRIHGREILSHRAVHALLAPPLERLEPHLRLSENDVDPSFRLKFKSFASCNTVDRGEN